MGVFVLELADDGLPRYVMMNQSARETAQLQPGFVEGKTAAEIFGEVTGRRALALHLGVVRSGQETTYEVSFPLKSGPKEIRTTLTPIYNEDGQLEYLLGTSVDITSEKQRDTALELMHLAKDAAEEASDAKEQFLANMSHEIRTPMNGIIGMCELLQETELSSRQRLYSDTIFGSANALLGIINDVLDFSKIQAGKISIHDEPFSLRRLVHETQTLLRVRADSKELAFDVEYDKSVPSNFLGDASRIRQVLLNLIINAIKFTEHGRIDVRVGYHKEAARLPLTISVRDTGRGIDVDEHDLVFSAFEQSDKLETRSEDGTGLGLAISQALVERMNGKIKLDSQLGHGSTFTIYLGLPTTDEVVEDYEVEEPLLAPYPPPEDDMEHLPVQEKNGATLQGMRILVAEDNRVNQLVVSKMLGSTGADLHFVPDGAQAVEAYKAGECDLILMDLSMPVLGGLEATRQIRAYEKASERPACKIIAVTANAQPSDAEACMAAGMDDFLSKPFRKGDLISIIEW
mmetsp:Transcript_7514/g.12838  ORF Transcript_7514/g.12838 Transcript_7514/m.12838 type:complete len:517 (+) Transcript_7514:862-2412(+)